MRMRLLQVAACVAALGLTACGGDDTPRPTTDGGSRIDSGLRDGGGTLDAPTTGDACVIDCAAPPLGCHYEGTPTCEPPSCGTLVCDDGAVVGDDAGSDDAGICRPPVECPAPPEGCNYVGGTSCSCGALVCDDAGVVAGMCDPSDPASCPRRQYCALCRSTMGAVYVCLPDGVAC